MKAGMQWCHCILLRASGKHTEDFNFFRAYD